MNVDKQQINIQSIELFTLKLMRRVSYLHVEQIGLNEQNTTKHTYSFVCNICSSQAFVNHKR